MRKQYKEKKRTCGLCKPHKRGWAKRWKLKDLTEMRNEDTGSPLIDIVNMLANWQDRENNQTVL